MVRASGRVIGEVLLNPLSLACSVVWALNDHLWKQQYASWWTGKLSDVCSLVVFPLFLLTAWQALLLFLPGARLRRVHLYVIVGFVALAFSAMNLFDAADSAYRFVVALLQAPEQTLRDPWSMLQRVHHTSDPTDLLTLPALGVALHIAAPHLDSSVASRPESSQFQNNPK